MPQIVYASALADTFTWDEERECEYRKVVTMQLQATGVRYECDGCHRAARLQNKATELFPVSLDYISIRAKGEYPAKHARGH